MRITNSLKDQLSNNQLPDVFAFALLVLLFLVVCALLVLVFVSAIAGVSWVIGAALSSNSFWKGFTVLSVLAVSLGIGIYVSDRQHVN